jgi:hypothetical protein
MSIEKIRKAFKEFKEECDGFTFVEPQIIELLSVISEHLLKAHLQDSPKELTSNYITLKEFEKRYKFIASNTLCRMCNQDREFAEKCAYYTDGRWHINQEAALEILKKRRCFKKRLERLGENC